MVRIKNTYHDMSIFCTDSVIVPISNEANSENTENKADDGIVSPSIEKNNDDTESDDETSPSSRKTVSHDKLIGKRKKKFKTVKKGRPRKVSQKKTPSSDVCLPSVQPPSSDARPPSVNVSPNEYTFPFCAPRGEDPSTYVAGPPIPLHSTGAPTIRCDHFNGVSSRVVGVGLDPLMPKITVSLYLVWFLT